MYDSVYTFPCNQRVSRTSSSRLSLVGWLSSHRVDLHDPSHRASLCHPVSSLANRPSEERELSPLVPIVQAALSPLVAQPKATPVAIRPLGEDLNPTKERTSYSSSNVSDQVLVAPCNISYLRTWITLHCLDTYSVHSLRIRSRCSE